MNAGHTTITIDLVLDRSSTQDVLRAILHAILFHRLFGLVKPQIFDILEVTMPGVKDKEIEALVEKKVDAFTRAIGSGTNKRGQITLTLSEKKQKKGWFQVYDVFEEVPWETWIVNAEIRHPKSDREREQLKETLSATLTKAVHTMMVHASSEEARDIVPPITNANEISPFPINVVVSVGGVQVPNS
ncbi:hypothetical protein MIND_00010200 [Mycena indigotica]|uniref:Autophagy-related protein 101 n=1 Tax=Mycena indigotica TaxID=2126181 RepID=A0A8H6TCK5_9AGAR|nr:uncharacterized protein MIND_00010200 [Mycena indigotica]KAF7314961.1 hypothetical protein MIND_00010200 [Mycena indigotica]